MPRRADALLVMTPRTRNTQRAGSNWQFTIGKTVLITADPYGSPDQVGHQFQAAEAGLDFAAFTDGLKGVPFKEVT